MKHRKIKHSLNIFNLLFVATFFVLALYSAIGQQIFPFVGQYRQDVETYLSKALDSQVEIRTLSGGMDKLTPSVHIEGVTLYAKDHPDRAILSIAAIDAEFDPRQSLINLTPVFNSVRLSGVYIRLSDDQAPVAVEDKTDNSQLIQKFVEALLLQNHVELNNVTVDTYRGKQLSTLHFDNLSMLGDGVNRLMTGSVSYGQENKIKAGLRVFSKGSPYDLANFYARGVLDLPNLDVEYWLDQILQISAFDEFDASAQLAFEFKAGLLNYAKLSMATPTLQLSGYEPINNVNTQFWLSQLDTESWTLWLENGDFPYKDKNWSLNNLGVKLNRTIDGNRWHGFIKDLDLAYAQDLMNTIGGLPDSITSLLTGLSPTGRAHNFSVIAQQSNTKPIAITVAGELSGVQTQAMGGIPAISNVNAVIAANKEGGRVQFSNSDMQLAFPNLYHDAFEIKQGRGQVDWRLKDNQTILTGRGLDIVLNDVEHVKGGFQMWMPTNKEYASSLALNLSVENAQVSAQKKLVPYVVNEGLRNWLDESLQKGQAKSGNFYLYSYLDQRAPLSNMELYLDVDDAKLTYLKAWPTISSASAKLFVDNQSVHANISNALTQGGSVKQTYLKYFANQQGGSNMYINGKIQGQGTDALFYLQQTPLQDVVSGKLNDWQLTGTHTTTLGLKIPFNDSDAKIKADVVASIAEADLSIGAVDLSFTKLNGAISYSTSKGLTANKIQSVLFNNPVVASISSDLSNGAFKTNIKFDSKLNMAAFKKWMKLGLLTDISGETQVAGNFIINSQDRGFNGLKFTSDLSGVSINLPAPFNKKEADKVVFQGSLQLAENQILKIKYQNKLNLAIEFGQSELKSGQIYFGSTEAYVPMEKGLSVQGHLPTVNLNDWMDSWQRIQKASVVHPKEGVSQQTILNHVSMSTDLFQYNDFKFEHIKASIKASVNKWDFNIDAPIAKGDVTYVTGAPIDVKLEYLHWPMIRSEDKPDNEKIDPLLAFQPANLPEINFKAQEIFIGPTNYGVWAAQLRSSNLGASLENINGEIKKLAVKGRMSWQKNMLANSLQRTEVDLDFSSNDVGGIQRAWQKKTALEAKSGRSKLKVNWLSSPADPDFKTMNGSFSVNLKDGRFIDVGDNAGGLSAFGLLNFSAIGRRLRLDFSDVYQSGFHFDTARVNTNISNGVVKIVDTLDIKGPSAKFSASGSINTLTKQLDQELSVTFPITGTLPFLAILAGFAPPVAASIFVGEQLVGGEIEKFTSATYKLTGSWEDPKLNLMKRFDNNIEGKKNKSFWHRMKDVFGMGDD